MSAWRKVWVLVMTFASMDAFGSQDSAPLPNDTAPVDWDIYQQLWIKDLPRATSAEPVLDRVDEHKAVAFLDATSLKWTRQNKCGTCHTNLAYLMVRPLLSGGDDSAFQEVRISLKAFAVEQQAKSDEHSSFLVASIASALAVSNARGGGEFDPDIRKMFDYLWTTQQADGGWRYPLLGMLPLLERNNYYLSLLVALGIGYLPGHYYESLTAREGFAKLQAFLRQNIPDNMHERAVLLWASVRTPGLLSPGEQTSYEAALLKLQNTDGGWTLPALTRLPRHDGAPNNPKGPSDGYATGLVMIALCERGHSVRDPSIRRAISWIDTHQRASGRWFTASTYTDRFQNYLSNMATAYALMALKGCGTSAKQLDSPGVISGQ